MPQWLLAERRRPESAIRQRLLTLDYLLANRGGWLLTTDAEKVDYFETLYHVPRAFLILKNDRFIDRQPILVGPKSMNFASVISYCCVASQPFNPRRFRSFLRRRRYIWECLEAKRLAYVTNRKWNPVLAEREFRALADRSFPSPKRSEAHASARDPESVSSQTGGRDRAPMEPCRQGSSSRRSLKWRLGTRIFDSPYEEWQLIADQAIHESISVGSAELRRPPDFETLLVDADYTFLSA